MLPAVTMGPWVPVGYKPDEIIIMRRNPYFIEVDDQGNQLPYLDEISFKLSTWEDRTIQTVAGTADYTNMEDPNLYLESLKKVAEPNFPNNLFWSVRSLSWRVDFNLSTVCGVDSDADKAKRELFRQTDFRRAVTQGIDRDAMAQALVKGPFVAPFAGGLHVETDFFKPESVVYYPYDVATSKALLKKLGLEDTDGDGYRELGRPVRCKGQNLEITFTYGSHPGLRAACRHDDRHDARDRHQADRAADAGPGPAGHHRQLQVGRDAVARRPAVHGAARPAAGSCADLDQGAAVASGHRRQGAGAAALRDGA